MFLNSKILISPHNFQIFQNTNVKKFQKNFRQEKNIFSKQIFLGHASPLKTSKIKFYCNPTTELAARPPYIAVGNLPKMKQIPMFWDILQRAASYVRSFELYPRDEIISGERREWTSRTFGSEDNKLSVPIGLK